MAITVDHTQVQIDDYPEGGNTQIIIPSFLTDSSISLLVVCVEIYSNDSGEIMQAVYNETTLNMVDSVIVNQQSSVAMFYLAEPGLTLGDNNIYIDIKNPTEARRACAYALTGTETIFPVDSSAYYDFDVSEGIMQDITTTTNGCIIIDIQGHGFSIDQVGAETEVMNSEDATTSAAGSQYYIQPTAGLKTMQWAWAGESPAAYLIAAFKPLAASPINTNQFFLFFN